MMTGQCLLDADLWLGVKFRVTCIIAAANKNLMALNESGAELSSPILVKNQPPLQMNISVKINMMCCELNDCVFMYFL